MKGDLDVRTNGTDHLPLVPGITYAIADPRVREALLMLDFEGESPASTGPLPHGPSVLHGARACAARENQPIGLAFVAALTAAVVEAWGDDGELDFDDEHRPCGLCGMRYAAPGMTACSGCA